MRRSRASRFVQSRSAIELDARDATPREVFLARRAFLVGLGLGAGSLAMPPAAAANEPPRGRGRGGRDRADPAASARPDGAPSPGDGRPLGDGPRAPGSIGSAAHNPAFFVDGAVTPRDVAGRYNNYYEFTTDKERVHELARGFRVRPWTLSVGGLCERPLELDVDDLIRSAPLEERVYRHRCVEAWSMVVPWTGFSLSWLLDRARPASAAKYVRFLSLRDPERMPGQRTQPWYAWPYHEGLRLDEARNELAMLVVGAYGAPLPPQHGAPIRLAVPWKYGFKSAKAIVRIELVAEQPPTFWNGVAPTEYDFSANVDPAVPHPRWSQATERRIDTGERIPTLPFNGYAERVAQLYRRR